MSDSIFAKAATRLHASLSKRELPAPTKRRLQNLLEDRFTERDFEYVSRLLSPPREESYVLVVSAGDSLLSFRLDDFIQYAESLEDAIASVLHWADRNNVVVTEVVSIETGIRIIDQSGPLVDIVTPSFESVSATGRTRALKSLEGIPMYGTSHPDVIKRMSTLPGFKSLAGKYATGALDYRQYMVSCLSNCASGMDIILDHHLHLNLPVHLARQIGAETFGAPAWAPLAAAEKKDICLFGPVILQIMEDEFKYFRNIAGALWAFSQETAKRKLAPSYPSGSINEHNNALCITANPTAPLSIDELQEKIWKGEITQEEANRFEPDALSISGITHIGSSNEPFISLSRTICQNGWTGLAEGMRLALGLGDTDITRQAARQNRLGGRWLDTEHWIFSIQGTAIYGLCFCEPKGVSIRESGEPQATRFYRSGLQKTERGDWVFVGERREIKAHLKKLSDAEAAKLAEFCGMRDIGRRIEDGNAYGSHILPKADLETALIKFQKSRRTIS